MSTKTTFKRVALVAVASLGFGMLSVVPSQAAQLVSITQASAPATGVPSTAVRSVVSLNGICDITGQYGVTNYMAVWTSIPATSRIGVPSFGALTDAETALYSSATTNYAPTDSALAFSGEYQNVGYYRDISANSKSARANNTYIYCSNTGRYAQLAALSFTPDVAGTYTMMMFDPTNTSTQLFWTVTVAAPVTASITSFINTTTGSAATTTTPATSRVASSTASATPAAIITVRQYSSSDTATAILNTYASAVTATVSGAGILGAASSGANRATGGVSVLAAGTGVDSFYLFPDGRTGTATVTVTVGTLVKTHTFTFYGSLSTYARDAVNDEPLTHIGIGESDPMNIVGLDATGNLTASAGTIYAKSSDTKVASVTVANQLVTVTGVASGAATITVCNTVGCVAPTKSITIPVAVAKTTAASFTLAFDKAEYTPGEKMTITVKAVDSNGAGVADGSRNLFSSAGITSNTSLTGATWTAATAVTVVAGVKTYTVYAPLVPGTVSIMATQGTAVDAVAAGGTPAVVSATAAVVTDGVAQAAADAAAEATDAANAATDAANAAAEAADAATAAAQDASDAVAALSTQVTTMIDALKKQITALTNLVIKIQKKVKA